MPRVLAILLGISVVASVIAGCEKSARTLYHNAEFKFAAQDFTGALTDYEKVLEKQPDSVMALLGKAKCEYKLSRWKDALLDFESFLGKTTAERGSYRNERYDAEFFRDKCRQELGEEVPQDPRQIPPPPMGE